MVAVLKDAEPFSSAGNDIGVLVLHGFTGTTQSIRHLGTELHRQFGFTVEGPCLPGHGTSPDDMEATTYLDWLGHVEDALQDLSRRTRKVFITGLSMGGTLTLNLAARFPHLVSGIAPIAAAVGPLSEDFAAVVADRNAPRRVPGIGSDIKAPGVEEVAYGEVPVACMRSIMVLISATRDLVHKITCPALVIHGRDDHVVPPANALNIVTRIGSDDVRLLWLNESYHVATLDIDKDLIVERVGRFFAGLA
ncbi:alpha/beta fold hydrolase [Paraburkholderia sp. UYCP14C]|uniref:alpha/beta hydrolase n=1 Tax=Paraburkholderia sp. UYCP14C TaxID=2511130 RepID=UPI0010218721|nr:alpha/beta fold hydrolase [Paraburkholderia sp. UYCP14C]RZF29785.1 alpha/beta fold hydrolase [Paraburkholderia sp. UYCP14C]